MKLTNGLTVILLSALPLGHTMADPSTHCL